MGNEVNEVRERREERDGVPLQAGPKRGRLRFLSFSSVAGAHLLEVVLLVQTLFLLTLSILSLFPFAFLRSRRRRAWSAYALEGSLPLKFLKKRNK